MTKSGTIKIYDYSWDSAYIVMHYATWNCLQKYAWPSPGPSESIIIAEALLTFVMDDDIWNRLQEDAWPTPGPLKSWL
jgi:hypothetical protein